MNVPDPALGRAVLPGRLGGGGRRALERVSAWRPRVPGIAEVLHASFVEHVYPAHTHDTWTLLIVEDGAIRYDLDRVEHGAVRPRVTLLPPHIPHTGQPGVDSGFRKRVLYLNVSVLGADLAGTAADGPSLADPLLRRRIAQLHSTLVAPGEELEAESRLAFIRTRLHQHLQPAGMVPSPPPAPRLAGQLRELLDSRMPEGLTLREASSVLRAHPDSLVRSFTAAFGMPPHRYLIGRRIDTARRLLLAGQRIAEVAAATGFCDQAHLTRHFTRQIGTTPARYARSTGPRPPAR